MAPFKTCEKSGKDRNAIKCDFSLTEVHLRCNYLNYVDSQYIKFSSKTWDCFNCSKLIPFHIISNFKLYPLLSVKIYCDNNLNESCLALKRKQNLSYLFNDFNNFSSDIDNIPENINNSKYYDIDQLLDHTVGISSAQQLHV